MRFLITSEFGMSTMAPTTALLSSYELWQRGMKRIHILELSRNFGHQAALTAGLDAAEGDYIIMLDGDGQHPPAMIPAMLQEALAGYDIVLTQRLEQKRRFCFQKPDFTCFLWPDQSPGRYANSGGRSRFSSDLPPGTVGLAQYA